MKVRIVSTDGIPHNVQIWEHQTGEVIEGVVAAFIHPFSTKSRQITGEITVLATSVDIVMEADVDLQCPYCNHTFPVEAEGSVTGKKQDDQFSAFGKDDEEDSQLNLEDHLPPLYNATWPYGGQSGTFLQDAVWDAAQEMQKKLEKAYTDVQKVPLKRLTRTELRALGKAAIEGEPLAKLDDESE